MFSFLFCTYHCFFMHLFPNFFFLNLSLSLLFLLFVWKCRIYLTRRSTGMKLASFAISAVYRWLTNNLVQKPRKFTAAIVMTHNSHHVAMDAAKCFVLVRMNQYNSHHFIIFLVFSSSLSRIF